jgi:hypothetical protein
MRKLVVLFCFIMITVLLLSPISFGLGSQMSIDKAYEDLNKDKGNDCYVIGNFPLTHLKDQAVANPTIVSGGREVNNICDFDIRIELINTDKNKTYLIKPKPITGSELGYYHSEKLLAKNSNDPCWVLKIPAGNYQIRDFICSLILKMSGYEDFRAAVVDVPINKLVNKTISFSAQAKQIIYLGDYDSTFRTYICLYAGTQLYTFRDLKIDLKDNFETVKTNFINGADDKVKEKLNGYEFISILH